MKTVFIFDSYGESPVKFILADGDYSRFEGVYINAYYGEEYCPEKKPLQGELQEFLWTEGEEWKDNVEYLSTWPYPEGDYVVVNIGCIP